MEAEADLDRVLVIDEAKRELTLSDERIEKAITQNGARLIILDPIQAYMGDKADMNKANEVRPIFRRLAEVAERTGCAVIWDWLRSRIMQQRSMHWVSCSSQMIRK